MQRLATIKDKKFPLSYNDKLHPDSLPDGYCVLIQNGFLDDLEIKERTGYSLIANDTAEDKPVIGMHAHETPSHNQLLKINDNSAGTAANLFYWNGSGSWVKVASPTFSPGRKYSMVTAYNKTYITNGLDVVKSWDGTTLTNVAGIPISFILVWFHDFLWAMNESSYPSRANFSNQGDPETFTMGDYLDIGGSDNDIITGASTLKDELIIGKQFTSYSFQGWTESAFSVKVVNEKLKQYGVVGKDAFVNIGNDLLFMSYGGSIPHVNSLVRTTWSDTIYGAIVTDPIEGTMRGLSKGQLELVTSIFDGRYAWFFVPNGSSTYNDLAFTYDSVTKGFAKHTGIYAGQAVVSTVSGEPKIYFGDSRNSRVYVFDDSTSDNGEDIDFQFISKQFTPDFKRLNKFKYLFLEYKQGSTGILDVYTSIDSFNYDLLEQIDLSAVSTVFTYTFPFPFGTTDQVDYRIELPYSVNMKIQVKFAKNDQTARTSISDYALMGFQKAIRDLP